MFTLLIEVLLSKEYISWTSARSIHVCNLLSLLGVPILVIYQKYEQTGPAMGTVATITYSILFLKMWSYIQVNHWCRTNSSRYARHQTKTMGESKENNNNVNKKVGHKLTQYPDNLNLTDVYYFWMAPTLCYELNFPKMARTRKLFLLRRFMEVLIGTNIALALIQQWIIPSAVNSLIPFSKMQISKAAERLLKLAIPNHLIWLTWFYLIFHSFLNTLGELLRFGDREFYRDWWNAENILVFWKSWNIPVHRWCVRHVFKPLLRAGYSPFAAQLIVFFISAFFHEYLISAPLRVFKLYAFIGMFVQIPLIFVSQWLQRKLGPRAGNLCVWLSLIVGQPMAIMMYYMDFVIEHYGAELIEFYGKM